MLRISTHAHMHTHMQGVPISQGVRLYAAGIVVTDGKHATASFEGFDIGSPKFLVKQGR